LRFALGLIEFSCLKKAVAEACKEGLRYIDIFKPTAGSRIFGLDVSAAATKTEGF
jgi:hypothetical protein